MPRNKSEKLPSHPLAYEYAQAVERQIHLQADRDCTVIAAEGVEERIVYAWNHLDSGLCRESNNHIRRVTGGALFDTPRPERRKMRAAYFLERYGP